MDEEKEEKKIISFLNKDIARKSLDRDIARDKLSEREEGEEGDEQRNDSK